jgi:Viral BACON domain
MKYIKRERGATRGEHMNVFRIAVLALFGCLLSGCSGGGGGGQGASGSGPDFKLSLDRTSLTFQATEGGTPPAPQTIVATWTGTPPDPAHVAATVQGTGIVPTIPTQISASSATATVSVVSGLVAGTYTGTISFLVCRDAACNQRVGGSPLAVSFTINVASGAVTSTAPISFQYVAGNTMPAPRKLEIAGDAGAWHVGSSAAWLKVSPASGRGAASVDVSFDPSFAAAGAQSASITVVSAKGTQVIPVSLNYSTPITPNPGTGTTGGDFTASATNVTFTARRSGTPPANQTVALHLADTQAVSLGAAFTGSAPDWLSVAINGEGADYELALRVTNTNKAVGTHMATLAVGTLDAGGNVLKRQDIAISMQVLDVISASPPSIAPNFILGSSTASASSTISIVAHASTPWEVASSAPWVTTSVDSGTGSSPIVVTVNSNTMDIGTHAATLTITNTGDPTNTVNLAVSANVTPPTIAVSSGPVVLGSADGLGTGAGNIVLSINTGTNTHAWTATTTTASGDAWLTLPSSSGAVGSTSIDIAVDGDRAAVEPGAHEGTVHVQVTVRGRTYSRSVPIVLNKEGHWLNVSSLGAAFSSFPGRAVLSRSIQVASSRGRTDVPWSAASDSSWLAVTPSGTTGGALQLTADPTGLAQHQTHIATVTVSSSDPDVENQQAIRVAFWAGATDPQDESVSISRPNIIANPVEPWVYVNNGGNTIEIYNVYSGALVNTWTTAIPAVGDMAISQDGTLLFVNDATAHAIVALNAQSGATVRTYPYSPNSSSLGIAYINVGARPTLAIGRGGFYDVASGREHSVTIDAGWYGGMLSFAVDPLSRYFYTQNMGLSASTVSKYSIRRTALTEDGVAIAPAGGNSGGSNGQDICVSSDGEWLYTSNGHPYVFYIFAASSFQYYDQLPGDAYPNNTECGWNGIFVGGSDSYYATEDVFVYRADQSQLTTLKMGDTTYNHLTPRSLVLSGDNTRVIGSTSRPSLALKSIPAP